LYKTNWCHVFLLKELDNSQETSIIYFSSRKIAMSASDPPTQSDWYMDCLRELIQDEIKATLDRKEAIENMATKSSQNPKPTRTTENHDNLEIRLRALEMTINRSRAFVTAADVDDASSSTGTQTPVTVCYPLRHCLLSTLNHFPTDRDERT
jgi:hypothetical protein